MYHVGVYPLVANASIGGGLLFGYIGFRIFSTKSRMVTPHNFHGGLHVKLEGEVRQDLKGSLVKKCNKLMACQTGWVKP